MADKTAIRKTEKGEDGKLKTYYIDAKTKRRLTSLKGYTVQGDKDPIKDDNKKTGFAVPKLVRGEDGTNRTVYVDPDTGKEVKNLDSVTILDGFSKDLEEIGLKPVQEKDKAKKEVAKAAEEKRDEHFSVDDRRNDQNHTYGGGKGKKREMANDYGYVNRPGIVNAAGMLPGPLGMMGKAVNLGLNLNNNKAVSEAREVLGLEKRSNIKGAITDQKGYIGDVNYNGVTSPVGFEAQTKDGRTTLTPNEARMRDQISGGITEATGEERRDNVKAAQKDNPRGLLGRFIDTVTGPAKDLAASVGDSIRYGHPERGAVDKGLNPATKDVMSGLATNTPGGLDVTSAYRDPHVNASVGGAKNSLHMQGGAFDVSTKGLSDQEKRDMVERAIMSGSTEMGTYDDGSLHFAGEQRVAPTDPSLTGGVTAMYERSRDNYNNAPGWYKDGIENSRLAGTPTPRPDYEPGVNPLNGMAFADLSPAYNPFGDDATAGLRNNNPGNIKYTTPTAWQGIVGPSVNTDQGDPQVNFKTPEDGIRAMSTLIDRKYQNGKTTANSLIAGQGGWTPGNLRAAKNVAASMGLGPDEDLNLNDPVMKDNFMRALITQEHGPAGKKVTNEMIANALKSPNVVDPTTVQTETFGNNLKTPDQIAQPQTYRPTPAMGLAAVGSASVTMKTPSATLNPYGGMVSDENANANRQTNQSTATGATRTTGGFAGGLSSSVSGENSNRGGSSTGLSSSSGSGGGFGVGGDRSSAGKSSYGGSTGSNRGGSSTGGSLSTSTGSGGGFGVGGDRSSEGKSSYGGSGTSSTGNSGRNVRDDESKGGYGSNNTSGFGGPR